MWKGLAVGDVSWSPPINPGSSRGGGMAGLCCSSLQGLVGLVNSPNTPRQLPELGGRSGYGGKVLLSLVEAPARALRTQLLPQLTGRRVLRDSKI